MPRDPRSRRSRTRSRSRSPDASEEEEIRLPHNASAISESDYFRKGDEFRVWLRSEKRKHFDELSSDRARSYFRKFVRAWNKGKLSSSLYTGVDATSVTEAQTSYKWSFASKRSRADDDALRAVRQEVGAATHGRESATNSAPGSSRVRGPTLPSSADLVYARELERENDDRDRGLKRKRDRADAKDRVEDMVGPKEVGREGILEKKRAKRESDRAFRDKADEGLEADESVLIGSGDSFKDQIARRDAARKRHEAAREEKISASRERTQALRDREDKTMAMFQALAKQRYG